MQGVEQTVYANSISSEIVTKITPLAIKPLFSGIFSTNSFRLLLNIAKPEFWLE